MVQACEDVWNCAYQGEHAVNQEYAERAASEAAQPLRACYSTLLQVEAVGNLNEFLLGRGT